MKGIVWLASYPKSGNTWLRAFLANYLWAENEPLDINRLGGNPIASARELFDNEIGVAASDLNYDEVKRLRPLMYRRLGDLPISFVKVHDAYLSTPEGQPYFPPEFTHAVIYLIRNPLDVAVSYAHHNGCSVDHCISLMALDTHQLSPRAGGLPNQLPQTMESWGKHVTGWVDAPGMRVHVMRYEDMKREPLATFAEALRFVGFPEEPARVEKAVRFSDFQTLSDQEAERGFREKPRGVSSFFRKGEIDDWRRQLSKNQWRRVLNDHHHVMERFGYLERSRWPEGPSP